VDPIIQTLTLAVVLLIIGLACVVIGVAGLIWIAGRDSRGKASRAQTLVADEFLPPTSAQLGIRKATHRGGRADAHRDGAISSSLTGHPQ
jgi:hypothetical protein